MAAPASATHTAKLVSAHHNPKCLGAPRTANLLLSPAPSILLGVSVCHSPNGCIPLQKFQDVSKTLEINEEFQYSSMVSKMFGSYMDFSEIFGSFQEFSSFSMCI
jgi:hypothetical protein